MTTNGSASGPITVERSDWELVRWIEAPEADQYIAELRTLGEELILPG